MSVLHPNPGPHPVHTVHRVSAATMGALLIGFAAVSFARGVMPTSTGGLWVLGLSSNGPLSILSIVVGCLLLGAAYRSGTAASNVSILFGVLFLLSGLINSVLISTSLNLLAFQLTNVVFSFGAGLSMLVLGSYGRISGALPPDNPYRHSPVEISAPRSALDLGSRPAPTAYEQLAEAERAAALRYATAEQLRRVGLVRTRRSAEDRLQAWIASE